jgi:hypothetical protein
MNKRRESWVDPRHGIELTVVFLFQQSDTWAVYRVLRSDQELADERIGSNFDPQ